MSGGRLTAQGRRGRGSGWLFSCCALRHGQRCWVRTSGFRRLREIRRIDVHDDGSGGKFFCGTEGDRSGKGFCERGAVGRFQHELEAIIATQAGKGRGGWTENFYAAFLKRREIAGERAGPANCIFDFAIAYENGGKRREGRIVQDAPEVSFLFVKRNVVLLRGVLNRVVIGKIGLD